MRKLLTMFLAALGLLVALTGSAQAAPVLSFAEAKHEAAVVHENDEYVAMRSG